MFVSQKTEKWKSGILIHNWNNCFLLTNNVVNYVLCSQWQINYFSYVCEYLTYFHSIKQMTGFRAAWNGRRTVHLGTSSWRTTDSYGASHVHLSRERHESWKNQSRRQPWVHLQRPLQASLRNLLAVYDAPKGKSVQGFSVGAWWNLPSREERPQPFCGGGSYYGTKNNFTVRSKALEDKFRPASAIVNEVC